MARKPKAKKPAKDDKRRRFIDEYMVDSNAAQAAIRAGFSPRCARQIGSRLLTNVDIAAAIRERQAKLARTLEIKSGSVLAETANLAFSDIGDILDFTGAVPKLKDASTITPEARRCIAGIKVKRHLEGTGEDAREVEVVEFKLWDKGQRLRDLAQHLGLLKDATSHPPVPPPAVNVNVTTNVVTTKDVFKDVLEFESAFEAAEKAERADAAIAAVPAGGVRSNGSAKHLDPAPTNGSAGSLSRLPGP